MDRDVSLIAANSFASQNKKELAFLLNAIKDLEVSTILEIGVHRGHSMKTWQEMFPGATVIGVDTGNELEEEQFRSTFIQGDSTSPDTIGKVKDMLAGRNIDFLFIDGNHLQPYVQLDFDNYSKFVRDGGVIAFHDVWLMDNSMVEVHKTWGELKRKYTYMEMHDTKFGGTGIGIIFYEHTI